MGVRECWNPGIMEQWNNGIVEMDCWIGGLVGIMECWNDGILEYWNVGIMESSDVAKDVNSNTENEIVRN